MPVRFLSLVVLLSVTYYAAGAVFKTCEEKDFCNRLRYKDDGTIYSVKNLTEDGEIILKNNKNSKELFLKFNFLYNSIRLTIDELEPSPRFRLEGVLDGSTPEITDFKFISTKEKTTFYSNFAELKFGFEVHFDPFYLRFIQGKDEETVAIANANQRLTMETDEPNVAIALDIHFPKAQRAYGIPEHADILPLRTTINKTDPYRLFNVDMPTGLNSPMSLYGSVPVLYAHGTSGSVGIFWHNAAETWVEIDNRDDGVNTYFMTESGVLDFFMLMGSTPQEQVREYASLTGTAPLPQYFTLAYHQSRYNYFTQEEVQTVVAEFDNHDFPIDVMWLDIEYTDGKKYFTWHPENFPNPLEMQANLTATNRKLVTIIDPHIKKEVGYFVYDQALAQDFFVKNANGSVYEGDCWPGLSSYLDFLNPDAVDYYAGLYAFDKFNGSTENTYIWNDMNEPAVFDDFTEKTFPKDVVHYGNVKHRDVHNIYGFLQTKGTYKGLLKRSENKRPFILSRSHFAGSQRYAGIWTGDNTANWGNLAISIPMCLSEAIAGISFCGADVGGFFNEPSEELTQRWFQLGAWLPFYRVHSTLGSEHREPYVYPENVQTRLRAAMRERYAHLPTWYTSFWEHTLYGDPVIRPLFYNYPSDDGVLDIDTQLLVGTNIMVAPVLKPDVNSIDVYFPGGEGERWYDAHDYSIWRGIGYKSVNVTIDRIPVYYRGGAIISRKDIPRPSSVETHNDPYSLYILPNDNNFAEGTLYFDDTESFDYQWGKYNYVHFISDNRTIKIEYIKSDFSVNIKIDRIVLADPIDNISIASITTEGDVTKEVPVTYGTNYLEVNNLGLELLKPFVLSWK